jgi:Protein of unknown function (DUF3999)
MTTFKPRYALASAVLVWACWSPSVQGRAATEHNDSIGQYTHALPLTFSGKDGLIQLRLPREVYLHARSTDLSDVRLFDARGNRVAFALMTPPPEERTSHRTVAVKVFPLMGVGGAGQIPAGVDIRTSPDGTLVSVNARIGAPGTAAQMLAGLVMDVRQSGNGANAGEKPLIDALTLTLPPGVTNYSARVVLDVSDDLVEWSTVGEAQLNWLTNSATETLANDHIEFEPRAFHYARLSWRNGTPLHFASVSAQLPHRVDSSPGPDTLLLEPEPGKFEGDLLYRTAHALPVQMVGLKFKEQNIVMPAVVGRYVELPSRKHGVPNTSQFEPFLSTTFYQLTQAGKPRASRDVAVLPKHADQWVVRPQGSAIGNPALRIGWWPATMVFVANGAGPYTLAVGRDAVASAQLGLEHVAPGFTPSELLALEHAKAGPAQPQPQRSVAAVPSEVDQAGQAARGKTAMLWGVLLLGLLVLGAMTWAMVKQLRNTGPATTGDDIGN